MVRLDRDGETRARREPGRVSVKGRAKWDAGKWKIRDPRTGPVNFPDESHLSGEGGRGIRKWMTGRASRKFRSRSAKEAYPIDDSSGDKLIRFN